MKEQLGLTLDREPRPSRRRTRGNVNGSCHDLLGDLCRPSRLLGPGKATVVELASIGRPQGLEAPIDGNPRRRPRLGKEPDVHLPLARLVRGVGEPSPVRGHRGVELVEACLQEWSRRAVALGREQPDIPPRLLVGGLTVDDKLSVGRSRLGDLEPGLRPDEALFRPASLDRLPEQVRALTPVPGRVEEDPPPVGRPERKPVVPACPRPSRGRSPGSWPVRGP
jgi:hypothetical protein